MSDHAKVKGIRWLPSLGEEGKLSDLVRVNEIRWSTLSE